MEFKSFSMSETTIKQIESLPGDLQLKFFWAISRYGMYHIEPDFSGLEKTIWIPMKDLIDNNEAKREAKRAAGKKGGEANKKTSDDKTGDQGTEEKADLEVLKQDIPAKAEDDVLEQDISAQPNGNCNGNINVNPNGNEKGNDNTAPPFSEPSQNKSSAKPTGPTRISPQDHYNPNSPLLDLTSWRDKGRIVWNELFPKKPEINFIIRPAIVDDIRPGYYALAESHESLIKAIQNHHKIINTPDKYDPGSCVYESLDGFLKNGVTKYCDAGNPFERFSKKQLIHNEPQGGSVYIPGQDETRRLLEEYESDRDGAESINPIEGMDLMAEVIKVTTTRK